jgi:hypothetical protein
VLYRENETFIDRMSTIDAVAIHVLLRTNEISVELSIKTSPCHTHKLHRSVFIYTHVIYIFSISHVVNNDPRSFYRTRDRLQ